VGFSIVPVIGDKRDVDIVTLEGIEGEAISLIRGPRRTGVEVPWMGESTGVALE